MTKESSTKHQVEAAHTIQVQSYGSEIQLVAEVAKTRGKYIPYDSHLEHGGCKPSLSNSVSA